ncbi:O-antigen ligase family protein [Sulfurimonas autotrophica]|uniref:O-antigen polymerase n=1 Tax=Sulfurimonas autotrophica (strain ATCC BAA-671 / DSM 16294 / JCM 11897 / OK10) TaxID=563040 RepID=E0UU28_SULAO|nr:O-antigen ligase family protein [Sulfurimonas autotrophica]ADN08337.1 O-antigen polymerase [Sulfurimonas autotrophica DSM 16294]
MKNLFKKDINTYINYLIIAYAFSFPISKAAVNIIEVLMILLWIYQDNWNHKIKLLKSSKFIIFISLFILYNVISILWASDTIFALNYIGKYHHFLMIPIIYTALEKKYINYVLSAFVASVFISEIMSYGIYFKLFTYKHATPEFPTPFMHHITYSVILAFTSTILLINFFMAKELRYKIFNILFFITLTINLFINGGRTGQLLFVILLFTLFFMFMKSKIKAIILSTVIIITILLLAYNFSSNFNSRIHQLQSGLHKAIDKKDYTDQGGMRIVMIKIGTETFLDNFIKGTGIGNVMKDANIYSAKNHYKTRDMHIFGDFHNVFINTAAQLGILGLIILLAIFYSLLSLKFKTKQYYILNLMFVISFILFSCTHNTFHTMNPMVFFVVFTGLFNAISRIETQEVRIVK